MRGRGEAQSSKLKAQGTFQAPRSRGPSQFLALLISTRLQCCRGRESGRRFNGFGKCTNRSSKAEKPRGRLCRFAFPNARLKPGVNEMGIGCKKLRCPDAPRVARWDWRGGGQPDRWLRPTLRRCRRRTWAMSRHGFSAGSRRPPRGNSSCGRLESAGAARLGTGRGSLLTSAPAWGTRGRAARATAGLRAAVIGANDGRLEGL